MENPLDQDAERKRIIRTRNAVMGLVLGCLAVLFFFITIAKLSG